MDEPAPPTAAELGISDAEYERILRDLRARSGVDEPPDEPATRRRRSSRLRSRCWRWSWLLRRATARSAGAQDQEPVYAFLGTNGDQPAAYSSCRLIQVAVYPAGGPPDAEQLVREAVARVRGVTGLDIVVTGSFGGHAPNWNFEAAPFSPGDPISVSWQDSTAIAELTDDIAGLGGSPVISSPSGTRYRVAGTIALSRDYYALLNQRGDHDEALAVLLHEFGHVVGLDHVDSSRELMNEDNVGRTEFGPGDLEGLRRLGQGPCI